MSIKKISPEELATLYRVNRCPEVASIAMFKKLKQKIEEGGEGGLERVSFSEKLPGSIVRTGANNGPVRVSSPLSLSTESNEDISPVQDLTSSREERGSQLSGSLHPSQNYSQQSLSYSQPSSDSENVISEESRSWDSREPLVSAIDPVFKK